MSEAPSTTARPTVGASERRPLTVLFADIVGSTAIAERMDPEDWTAIVSQAFARMNALFEAMEARPSLARALRDRAAVLRAIDRTSDALEADRRSREIAQQIGLKDFGT